MKNIKIILKKTWQTINNILNLNQNNLIENIGLNINDDYITDPKRIVDAFNNYFVNVGQELASKIKDANLDFDYYLKKRDSNMNSIYINPCTPDEIVNIIKELKNKTSVGIDNISNKLIKCIVDSIAKPLSIIINQSIFECKNSKNYPNL